MSGLKTSFVQLYAGALAIVNTGTPQAPNLVPEFLFRFMNRLLIEAAPYDQAKTLDPKFIAYSQKAIGGLTNWKFFDSIVYPQSEHFLIVAIRILTNATGLGGVWQPGIGAATALDGSFSVKNSKSDEMVDVPFNAFPLSTNVADQDSGFLAHEQGMLWQGQTTLTVSATWNAAVVASYAMDFQLWGAKLI